MAGAGFVKEWFQSRGTQHYANYHARFRSGGTHFCKSLVRYNYSVSVQRQSRKKVNDLNIDTKSSTASTVGLAAEVRGLLSSLHDIVIAYYHYAIMQCL